MTEKGAHRERPLVASHIQVLKDVSLGRYLAKHRKVIVVTTDWRVYGDIARVFKPGTWNEDT